MLCARRPKDASAHHGNPSPAVPGEQSRSAYFSSVGETQDLLNSAAKTKKTALQKLAKQASAQRELCENFTHTDQKASPQTQSPTFKDAESETGLNTTSSSVLKTLPGSDHQVPSSSDVTDPVALIGGADEEERRAGSPAPNGVSLNEASGDLCQQEISKKTSKRSKLDDDGEDPHPRRAKRTCLGRPPATAQTLPAPADSPTQTSKRDLLPPAEAKTESKAFPVSERTKTTVEAELLTPGKRVQRLPLTSNNTAQTNQNRLAASLRGLSVKPASSGSSIGSRSTLAEEGSENVPRTSRLRRLKKS